jgi:hypothetical protein
VSKLAVVHREAFETATATVFTDKSLLRRYGDILCDNIADQSMRSKTKSSSGETSQRCLCGVQRAHDAELVFVSIKAGEPPVSGYVCSSCKRFSAAYARISLDMEKFTSADPKQRSPTTTSATTASTASRKDSSNVGQMMDQFLESLIISFRDQTPSEKPPTAASSNDDDDAEEEETKTLSTAVNSNKRRRTTAPNSAVEQPLTQNELQGKLVEMRKKMSQSLLPQSNSSDPSIKNMFGFY